jgi:hypothetical protein
MREMETKKSTSKKSVYLSPILQNCVHDYGQKESNHWVDSFPHFFVLNTGSEGRTGFRHLKLPTWLRRKPRLKSSWPAQGIHRFACSGILTSQHCCVSMKFWYESGSADPYLRLMDPDADPDPAIFVSDLQDVPIFFFAYYFLKVHFHNFSKKKSYRSHKTVGINVFLTIFAWW